MCWLLASRLMTWSIAPLSSVRPVSLAMYSVLGRLVRPSVKLESALVWVPTCEAKRMFSACSLTPLTNEGNSPSTIVILNSPVHYSASSTSGVPQERLVARLHVAASHFCQSLRLIIRQDLVVVGSLAH